MHYDMHHQRDVFQLLSKMSMDLAHFIYIGKVSEKEGVVWATKRQNLPGDIEESWGDICPQGVEAIHVLMR